MQIEYSATVSEPTLNYPTLVQQFYDHSQFNTALQNSVDEIAQAIFKIIQETEDHSSPIIVHFGLYPTSRCVLYERPFVRYGKPLQRLFFDHLRNNGISFDVDFPRFLYIENHKSQTRTYLPLEIELPNILSNLTQEISEMMIPLLSRKIEEFAPDNQFTLTKINKSVHMHESGICESRWAPWAAVTCCIGGCILLGQYIYTRQNYNSVLFNLKFNSKITLPTKSEPIMKA